MKSFKEFISETPMVDELISKHVMRFDSHQTKSEIESAHHKATFIGDNNFVRSNTKSNVYYHKDKSGVKEISMIDHNDVQHFVDKGEGGDSARNHAFMKYHAAKHGKVSSDEEQSVGGKHLWTSLINSEPRGFTFHHVHPAGEEEITKGNLKEKESDIWGESRHKTTHTIEMRKV